MLCMLKCYYSVFRSLLNPCLEASMTANQSLCVCYYEELGAISRRNCPKPQHPLYFLLLYTINRFRDTCSSVSLEQQAQGRALSWCWAQPYLTPNLILGIANLCSAHACFPKLQPNIVPVLWLWQRNSISLLLLGGCSGFLGLGVPIYPCLLSVQAGSSAGQAPAGLRVPVLSGHLSMLPEAGCGTVRITAVLNRSCCADQPPCPAVCTTWPCHGIPRELG